jgi:hypothetical protein
LKVTEKWAAYGRGGFAVLSLRDIAVLGDYVVYPPCLFFGCALINNRGRADPTGDHVRRHFDIVLFLQNIYTLLCDGLGFSAVAWPEILSFFDYRFRHSHKPYTQWLCLTQALNIRSG